MNKRKIFNDPVYGFLYFPFDILYDLIDHPYFQRLKRISQLGLSHYVYPGAHHTRFHHALGAVALMTKAVETLRIKGISITDEEAEAVSIAILLHDIGHGPYSHALENKIVKTHHERISLLFMEELNSIFDNKLSLAIEIFKNNYSKKFLHQLVSSQLDMDRMDYLTRDSFYTGVAEGVIGYDRIIKMLHVVDGQLVVEEKGIYSIEKFIVSRRIMYWQVYLHKTVIAAEQMLILYIKELRKVVQSGQLDQHIPDRLLKFLEKEKTLENSQDLAQFALLDDTDILQSIKNMKNSSHFTLKYISFCLLDRKLFHIHMDNAPINCDLESNFRQNVVRLLNVDNSIADKLIIVNQESNQAYVPDIDEIKILKKDGSVTPYSAYTDNLPNTKLNVKYFLCYPKYKY
jgi:HD superfamily phosphohydrolase